MEGQPLAEPSSGDVLNSLHYVVCGGDHDIQSWHPEIVRFYRYYQGLPKQGRFPSRKAINPEDLVELLPRMWLLDVSRSPLRFKVRLMGTGLVHLLGVELTGKWLDETHRLAPNINAVITRFEKSVLEGCITYRKPSESIFHGRPHLNFENIIVPLASDGETIDILAGFTCISGGASGEQI